MSDVASSKRDLPNSWVSVPLGEVIQLQYGKGLTAKTRVDSGDVPVFGSSGDVGRHNQAYINEPCIIVGRKGNVGHIFISHTPCWPIDTVYYVIPPPGIDIKYLYYQLKNLNLARLDKSTAIPGINRNDAYKVSFHLAPSEQQKRIVAKIEELFSHIDAGIAALNKVKQLLKQYRKSVLKAAVTGELTKQWREENKDKPEPTSQLLDRILQERRQKWETQQLEQFKAKGKVPKNDKWKEKYKEPQKPAWEGMTDLVDSWTWVTIEQLASDQPRSIQSGPFGSNLKHSEFTEEGKLVVGIDNVREGFFSMGSDNRISEEKYKELERFAARPGDVLITVMATIGRTCVIPEDLEPAIITKHVYRITIDKNLASAEYVNMYLWGAPDAREQFFGQTIGQTRPGLNGGIIKGVCLPLPSLIEQQQIFDAVQDKEDSIARLEEPIELQLSQAEKNKQAILSSAFAGDLVDHLASDGSAEDLLASIEASRLKAVADRPVKKKPQGKKGKFMKRLILDVLKEKGEVSVSGLMQEAGYAQNEIEKFYGDLSKVSAGIAEIRPVGAKAKSWPYDEEVKLKLK